jgi:hypothetical protein
MRAGRPDDAPVPFEQIEAAVADAHSGATIKPVLVF